MKNKETNFVSCVIYLHNDEDRIRDFLQRISEAMQAHFEKYEMICVDDGCTDGTVEELRAFLQQQETESMISLVTLSYYQGIESAMNAGTDLAVGDFIFEFDKCQMDFSADLIMEVCERALEGYDVVAAAPANGVSFSSRLFYWVYSHGSRRHAKLRQERFRVISRRVVNRINQMNVYVPYRKAMYLNSGLKTDVIVYNNPTIKNERRNREEAGSRSMLAVDTLIIFTNVFEKISLTVSGVLLVFLLGIFAWIVYSIFSTVRPMEGWMSLMALTSVGFFMLSVMLTLIFKYLAVILNLIFRRQRYVVEGVEKLTR